MGADETVTCKGDSAMNGPFPGGKTKAFTLSYDDGVLQDVRFVELLNRYGLKGTFNLNSELMYQQFAWTHESGMVVKRLPPEAVLHLYDGHEVASHTLTHPYLDTAGEGEILWQMGQDKANLEQLFGREIAGFAAPFDFYSPLMADCARRCGFSYARISQVSHSYTPPRDPFYWTAGIFHLEEHLEAFVQGFLETDACPAVCQIVGHTYDLDAENLWGPMEDLFRRVSEAQDVVFLTHIEVVRCLQAAGWMG